VVTTADGDIRPDRHANGKRCGRRSRGGHGLPTVPSCRLQARTPSRYEGWPSPRVMSGAANGAKGRPVARTL